MTAHDPIFERDDRLPAELPAAVRGLLHDAFQRPDDDNAADRLLVRLQPALRRTVHRDRISHYLRIASAAAACLILGATAGLWYSGRFSPASNNPVAGQVEIFQVALLDADGRELAVQSFDSAQQAHQFQRDLEAWRQQRQAMNEGRLLVVSESF